MRSFHFIILIPIFVSLQENKCEEFPSGRFSEDVTGFGQQTHFVGLCNTEIFVDYLNVNAEILFNGCSFNKKQIM